VAVLERFREQFRKIVAMAPGHRMPARAVTAKPSSNSPSTCCSVASSGKKLLSSVDCRAGRRANCAGQKINRTTMATTAQHAKAMRMTGMLIGEA